MSTAATSVAKTIEQDTKVATENNIRNNLISRISDGKLKLDSTIKDPRFKAELIKLLNESYEYLTSLDTNPWIWSPDIKSIIDITDALKLNKSITSLNLILGCIEKSDLETYRQATKSIAGMLLKCQSLIHLNLTECKFVLQGIEILTCAVSYSQLISLNLKGIPIGPNAAGFIAEMLQTNKTLTSLDVSNTRLNPDTMLTIVKVLPFNNTLTSINLGWNALRAWNSLIRNDDNNEHSNIISSILTILFNHNTLKALYLNDNRLNNHEGEIIGKALQTTKIKTVFLGHNSFNGAVSNVISKSLQKNTILQALNYSGNTMSHEAILAFANALKTNNTLLSLNLSQINFDETLSCIFETLLPRNNPNTALTSLILRDIIIKPNTFKIIQEVLLTNQTLQHLSLSRNNLLFKTESSMKEESQDIYGGKLIAEAIQNNPNTALKLLDLEGTRLQPTDVCAIAEMLKTNKTLTYLNMDNCKFCISSASTLADAVKANFALTYLQFSISWNEDTARLSSILDGSLKKYCQRNRFLARNWETISPTLACFRTHYNNGMQRSFLNLLPSILKFADITKEEADISMVVQKADPKKGKKAKKAFLETKYAQAIIYGFAELANTAAQKPLVALASKAASNTASIAASVPITAETSLAASSVSFIQPVCK